MRVKRPAQKLNRRPPRRQQKSHPLDQTQLVEINLLLVVQHKVLSEEDIKKKVGPTTAAQYEKERGPKISPRAWAGNSGSDLNRPGWNTQKDRNSWTLDTNPSSRPFPSKFNETKKHYSYSNHLFRPTPIPTGHSFLRDLKLPPTRYPLRILTVSTRKQKWPTVRGEDFSFTALTSSTETVSPLSQIENGLTPNKRS